VSYVGARAVPVRLREENGFLFDPEELASKIGCWTKLVFLNFPSNPTGVVATQAQLEELAEVILAHAPPGARVYSDESYEDIVFDGLEHRSIASVPGMAERTIIASGVSKSYAWTGGRIGWAILPTRAEAAVFKNLNINYFGSLPPYNQAGARTALESPLSAEVVRSMVESFQDRRDVALPLLNALPGVHCVEPQGAFYLFPNVAELLESVGALDAFDALPPNMQEQTSPATLFQMFLLHRYHLAVMDRRSFGVQGSEGEHFLRLSIATGLEDLREGTVRLGRAGRDRAGFEAYMKEERT
jgi:aspartate/methionine/tyrosine aminotransferase